MFNHENSTAEQRTNLNESSVNTLCMLHLLDPPSVGARKVCPELHRPEENHEKLTDFMNDASKKSEDVIYKDYGEVYIC